MKPCRNSGEKNLTLKTILIRQTPLTFTINFHNNNNNHLRGSFRKMETNTMERRTVCVAFTWIMSWNNKFKKRIIIVIIRWELIYILEDLLKEKLLSLPYV